MSFPPEPSSYFSWIWIYLQFIQNNTDFTQRPSMSDIIVEGTSCISHGWIGVSQFTVMGSWISKMFLNLEEQHEQQPLCQALTFKKFVTSFLAPSSCQRRDWQLTRSTVWEEICLDCSFSISHAHSLSVGGGQVVHSLPCALEMAVSIKYHFQFPCFMIPQLLSTNNAGPPTLSRRWLITLVSSYIKTFTWK